MRRIALLLWSGTVTVVACHPARSAALQVMPPTAVVPVLPPGGPMFLVTPARRAIWAKERASNHWLYQLAMDNCAHTGTPGEKYGETGFSCAWIYQVNGDRTAAQKVIAKLKAYANIPLDNNTVRSTLSNNVILADWIWNAATPVQRDTIVASLERWARYALGKTGVMYAGGCRLSDADQVTLGCYFGPALLDVFTRTIPGAPRWLDSTMTAGGFTPIAIGGLVATDTMNTTARNAVAYFAGTQGRGGEEVESTDYNPGTSADWVMGAEAMKTALGVDDFPELQRYFRAYAKRLPFEVTPDLAQAVEWGDAEQPHNFTAWLYRRVNMLGSLSGITGDGTDQAALQALWARYGKLGYNSAEPMIDAIRMLIFYDPGLPPSPLPTGANYAAGRGHLLIKDSSTLVSIEEQPPTGEDHQVHYVHNVTLYRDGEWALDHPYGYAGDANGPLATNGVSYRGFGAMMAKGVSRVDSGTGWWALTGKTGGSLYARDYWDPPPAFLKLGQRTTLYTTVSGWSVVVTFDTVSLATPASLARYQPEDRATLAANPDWYAVWHPSVAPTVTPQGWTWATHRGQTVQLAAFGTNVVGSVVDEHTIWTKAPPNLATLAQQLRIRTSGPTLLTVVLVGRGTPPVVTRSAHGVMVGSTAITITGSMARVAP